MAQGFYPPINININLRILTPPPARLSPRFVRLSRRSRVPPLPPRASGRCRSRRRREGPAPLHLAFGQQ
eukprot:1194490-Prorocentrum_minimum.AAC.5